MADILYQCLKKAKAPPKKAALTEKQNQTAR
jgi:hypothetical protein